MLIGVELAEIIQLRLRGGKGGFGLLQLFAVAGYLLNGKVGSQVPVIVESAQVLAVSAM
jgi:hypothetical protein